MIRFFLQIALGVALGAVTLGRLLRWWESFSIYGSADYWLIAAGLSLFVLGVLCFDLIAEETGLIVHQWWD